MSDLIDTVQLQETEDSLVTLFEITLPSGTVAYFFNGLDDGSNNIYFPEKEITNSAYNLNAYIAIPIEITGIASNSSGAAPRPNLSLANIPVLARNISTDNPPDGVDDEKTLQDVLNTEGVSSSEDLLSCRVTIRRTLLSKTYDSTDAPSVTTAPVEFPSRTYVIDRVSGENNLLVEFELANPMDIEGVVLPSRVVVGKYCPWKYQGHYLPDAEGNPSKDGGCIWSLDSRGRFFDKDDNIITKNISSIPTYNSSTTNGPRSLGYKTKTITNGHTQIWEAVRAVPAETSNGQHNPLIAKGYWKRLDVCGKTLNSCKIRFQGNNTNDNLDRANILPFGGFPGTKQYK